MTFCKAFQPTGNMTDKERVEDIGHAVVARSTEVRRKREGGGKHFGFLPLFRS